MSRVALRAPGLYKPATGPRAGVSLRLTPALTLPALIARSRPLVLYSASSGASSNHIGSWFSLQGGLEFRRNMAEVHEDPRQTVALDLEKRRLREGQARLKGNLQMIEMGFASSDPVLLPSIVTGSSRPVLEAIEHEELPALLAPKED